VVDVALHYGVQSGPADDDGIRCQSNRDSERRIDEYELRADRTQLLGARTDKSERRPT
jgi:hypothetical protein